MSAIIKAENIGKKYIIGHNKVRANATFRDMVAGWGRGIGERLRHPLSMNKELMEQEDFWALKDINFEIEPGDRVGIIGRNGSGKSTLLKILSRITSPTTGKVQINGRVASLLEVGTGFHPELTGRENIYLNGAILGMKHTEIRKKFDEIVDFAGVEKFLDTPVKRYSSGMYVRLAFAVAAHLEPEILLVDEVLAVGDAEFQKKCLGKMDDISKQNGRTILFVSHNMGAVRNLCNRAILLKQGTLKIFENNVENVISNYLNVTDNDVQLAQRTDRAGNKEVIFTSFEVNHGGDFIQEGEPLSFTLKYKGLKSITDLQILFSINLDRTIVFSDSNVIQDIPKQWPKNGSVEIIFSKDFSLPAGRYHVNVAALISGTMADYVQDACSFDIFSGDLCKTGKIPTAKGLCYIQQEWKVLENNEHN